MHTFSSASPSIFPPLCPLTCRLLRRLLQYCKRTGTVSCREGRRVIRAPGPRTGTMICRIRQEYNSGRGCAGLALQSDNIRKQQQTTDKNGCPAQYRQHHITSHKIAPKSVSFYIIPMPSSLISDATRNKLPHHQRQNQHDRHLLRRYPTPARACRIGIEVDNMPFIHCEIPSIPVQFQFLQPPLPRTGWNSINTILNLVQ